MLRYLALLPFVLCCSGVERVVTDDGGPPEAGPPGDEPGLDEPRQGCIPGDEICCDGVDGDCDGLVDEECGCGAECLCYPGTARYCDEPVYCSIGEQRCRRDGQGWTDCVEVARPTECAQLNTRYSPNFMLCIIDNDFCGQDHWDFDGDGDRTESVGDCSGIVCGWDDLPR